MAFGKEFKRLRTASKISAQKIFEDTGIPKDRVYKWEQRDISPRYDDTQILEECYGMTLAQLIKLDKLPKIQSIPSKDILPDGNYKEKYISLLEKTLREKEEKIRELENKDKPKGNDSRESASG